MQGKWQIDLVGRRIHISDGGLVCLSNERESLSLPVACGGDIGTDVHRWQIKKR